MKKIFVALFLSVFVFTNSFAVLTKTQSEKLEEIRNSLSKEKAGKDLLNIIDSKVSEMDNAKLNILQKEAGRLAIKYEKNPQLNLILKYAQLKAIEKFDIKEYAKELAENSSNIKETEKEVEDLKKLPESEVVAKVNEEIKDENLKVEKVNVLNKFSIEIPLNQELEVKTYEEFDDTFAQIYQKDKFIINIEILQKEGTTAEKKIRKDIYFIKNILNPEGVIVNYNEGKLINGKTQYGLNTTELSMSKIISGDKFDGNSIYKFIVIEGTNHYYIFGIHEELNKFITINNLLEKITRSFNELNKNEENLGKEDILKSEQIEKLLKDYPIIGNVNSKYMIVEYSELEGPFSKKLHDEQSIFIAIKEFGEDVAYLNKHFPLEIIHPTSRAKGNALECARELNGDKYYYDLRSAIFSKSDTSNGFMEISELELISKNLGIDYEKLNNCIISGKYDSKITDSMIEGVELFGISGVPTTIVINREIGKYIIVNGSVKSDAFLQALSEIEK